MDRTESGVDGGNRASSAKTARDLDNAFSRRNWLVKNITAAGFSIAAASVGSGANLFVVRTIKKNEQRLWISARNKRIVCLRGDEPAGTETINKGQQKISNLTFQTPSRNEFTSSASSIKTVSVSSGNQAHFCLSAICGNACFSIQTGNRFLVHFL